MKKQRSLPAIAAIAALTFALTACGGNNSAQTSGEPTATPSPTPTESASTAEPTEAQALPYPLRTQVQPHQPKIRAQLNLVLLQKQKVKQ